MRLLDRDLATTIIIDNLSENFELTVENGIHITDFFGSFEDRELYVLREFLLKMAVSGVEDVRKILVDYQGRYEDYL